MIKNTILFSVLLLVLAIAWNQFMPPNLASPAMPIIVIYFFISTVIVHRILIKTNTESPKNFIRTYMGTTALRLFLNLMVIIIYILVDRSRAMAFALAFLVFYFIYLIFEIISLQKDLKGK